MTDQNETTLACAAPDAGFLACPRCEGDDFAVVCGGVPHDPHIIALVCVECDLEIPIVNGRPNSGAMVQQ